MYGNLVCIWCLQKTTDDIYTCNASLKYDWTKNFLHTVGAATLKAFHMIEIIRTSRMNYLLRTERYLMAMIANPGMPGFLVNTHEPRQAEESFGFLALKPHILAAMSDTVLPKSKWCL